MQTITTTNWKKILLFGAGLLTVFAVMIITALYTTYRAEANQSSITISSSEEADMNIDVKVTNGPVNLENITSAMESDAAPLSSDQQNSSSTPNSDVEVNVNGTPIDVPENGSIHKQITTEDGTASIDVFSQSNTSSGDSRTRSSINIDVDSSTRIRERIQE